jgi:uncharacterized membrane protein
MNGEGPLLQALVHRLSECPPDFLEEPRIDGRGVIDAGAVISDLVRALGGPPLTEQQLARLRSGGGERANRIRVALVAAWLLHDSWFRARSGLAPAALSLLLQGLDEVAVLVDAPHFVTDADRREELVRLVLSALHLRPAGESEAQAADRLNTLNSVERHRVLRDTRQAQQRAREIREAMQKKAAEEAAASYGRE